MEPLRSLVLAAPPGGVIVVSPFNLVLGALDLVLATLLKISTVSLFFVIIQVILILIVVVFFIRFKRARDAARTKCTAPNNTKLNGDTTMTPPGGAPGTNGLNGNPYGTIQRCGSGMRRPINNGFTTLEQHPHNTLR